VLSKKAKTDNVDSLVIAGLLRSKEALASYVPEEDEDLSYPGTGKTASSPSER